MSYFERFDVGGMAAHDAAASGNPVRTGGKANASLPSAVANGDACDLWVTQYGNPVVATCATGTPGDAASAGLLLTYALGTVALCSALYTYNGSTWDRRRGNHNLTVLSSAARTSTTNSSDQVNYNSRRMMLIVNISNIGSSAGINPTLQVKDPVSGNYVTVWAATTNLTSNGTYVYYFGDGAGMVASMSEHISTGMVPRDWRAQITHLDGNTLTYSVAAVMLE